MPPTTLPNLSEAQLERINRMAARLVLAVVVVGMAHTLAQLTWKLLAPAPEPQADRTAPLATRPAQRPRRTDYASHIARAHLFGEAEAPRTQAAAPTQVPETRLNLTLRGVLAAPGEHAIALIASGSGPESVYQVGDPLPGGARLKEVLADRVVLERGGQLETLKLPKAEMTGFTKSEDSKRPTAPARPSRALRTAQALRERAASRALARLKQMALRNPQALARMVSATPVEQDGRLVGYRVNPGADRRLFGQLGLKPGDVVTSVNGIALTDPNDVLSVMQVLHDAAELTLTVQRDGTETTLTHAIGEPKKDDG